MTVPMPPELLTRTVSLRTFDVRAEGDGPAFAGLACPSAWSTATGPCSGRVLGGRWPRRRPVCAVLVSRPDQPGRHAHRDERADGLYIEGSWDESPAGQQARQRALGGSATELSVGFRDSIYAEDAPTEIIAVRLVEVSQITARIAASPVRP